tara:strand:+ start:1945 stop:2772 length:828 start_codon:yes stop_codon:yes gene_type:complete
MGTTQRIVPGVTREPNWGALSRSITAVAKTVEKEAETEEEVDKTPEEIKKEEKQYKTLIYRRDKHLKAAFKNLIRTGGGSKTVSSGKSKSLGRAGRKSAGIIAGFFSGVSQNGLQKELYKIGFGSLTGKSVQDIIDYLLIYTSDTNTGMDETAASKASCEVFDEIAEQTGNDIEEFEKLVQESVDGNGLENILCRFWGLYIFEHLSQRFAEKIDQQKGTEISKETFNIIKDDIIGRIEVLNKDRHVKDIDWNGEEGTKEIDGIFESIINIICDED